MRSLLSRALPAVLLVAVSAPAPRAQPAPRMVFPIVRSGWYSVINFTDDWHDPRMRRTADGWQLIGRHEGTDVFAEPGTPVVAILGGRVEQLGWTFYSGWRVGVRGDDGRYWFYAHLSSFAPGLSIGSPVAAGQQLGEVGNTGYGATPGHRDEFTYHLHLGIQEPDGTWVNPYPLVRRLYDAAVRRDGA
ncbi:MAG TPA: M23 family metallopeptidase [Actinomycetota bacterium]|nr:M23 family metallopeptidase [Actinomycetota bacterium]